MSEGNNIAHMRLKTKILTMWARHQVLVLAAALLIAIVLPAAFNKRYIITVMINCVIYGVLSISLNFISGVLGITSLGHAAFYGIGAYAAAILAKGHGVTFLATIPAGAAAAALAAFLLGLPILKSGGRHLAIITLGFCEIVRIIELNWMSLTNGPLGISRIPGFTFMGFTAKAILAKYYIGLVLLVISYYIVSSCSRSRVGRAIIAIRDNEIAAEAMGINVYRYKLAVFSASAALAGAAGAYYAHYISFIDPKSFSFDQSILILSMVILGGMGSIPGSVVGAVLLSTIPEMLRWLADYRLIIYGLVIVVMTVVRPNGIFGGLNLDYINARSRFRLPEHVRGDERASA